MTLILNDFLSAEKLEEGKVLVRKEECNLQDLTGAIMSEVTGILKVGQKLDYVHEGEVMAYFDKQIMRNVLLNLVSNAIKFSPENKSIKVRTWVSPKEIKIEVKDEGMGIPKDEQEHLFERFFRSKNATNIQGTGLGLNIVAKYLEVMRGQIRFESEVDQGTTFYLSIPNEAI